MPNEVCTCVLEGLQCTPAAATPYNCCVLVCLEGGPGTGHSPRGMERVPYAAAGSAARAGQLLGGPPWCAGCAGGAPPPERQCCRGSDRL